MCAKYSELRYMFKNCILLKLARLLDTVKIRVIFGVRFER